MKSRLIYFWNRFRRYRHAPLITFAGRIIMFILGGFTIGMTSAWYMIENGSDLTTVNTTSWQNWFNSGVVGADPYTLAYMARSGRLPITSSNALYFIAKRDNEGDRLYAECDYLVNGKPLDADWWSFAAYHEDGSAVRNSSRHSSVNSANVLRYTDGGYEIALAGKARSGNWIETTGYGKLVLVLRLYGIHVSKDTQRSTSIEHNLPVIRRVECH